MPATLSPVMGAILRNDLKFPGMIVTDALSMSGLTIYFTQEEAAVRALEAGADMLLKPADVDASFRGVLNAVKSGRITEQRVEESARKILAAKYDLGLVTNASRRGHYRSPRWQQRRGHWRLRLRNTRSRSFVMKTSWCR